MALHEKLVRDLKPLRLSPMYARPGEEMRAPRHTIPDAEMDPDTAYQFVHDELMLDGNARLNLATFVTTWMEQQAERLMAETRLGFDGYRRVQQECRDVARYTVRNGFSRDLADLLVADLRRHVEYLDQLTTALPTSHTSGFHH